MTRFKKLNLDWNAEPNAPAPQITRWDLDVVSSFYLNAFIFPKFREGDVGQLRFRNCWRYRLGSTNDEGWYKGQCRFSKIAPKWGEFYEVSGELLIDQGPLDWKEVGPIGNSQNHFLFYFRDETFDCDAESRAFPS